MSADRDRLVRQLVRHEGLRLHPYKDTRGKLTIGIGRNLTDVGLSEDECYALLDHDIDRAVHAASAYDWFRAMDPVRQAAIVNVLFNLGPGTFAQFTRMIAALAAKRYSLAAVELLDSKAARQTGSRYQELATQLKVGAWLDPL